MFFLLLDYSNTFKSLIKHFCISYNQSFIEFSYFKVFERMLLKLCFDKLIKYISETREKANIDMCIELLAVSLNLSGSAC